jgi:hypothetical protein
MNFEIDKKTADEIMASPGEVRGAVFKTDEKFILSKGGEEKIKEVEKTIKDWGYSMDYKNIESMAFYPIGLRFLSMLAAAKVFEMDEKGVEEMGSFAPKVSLIIKFFLQYFLSAKKTFNQVSHMWEKHYTVGKVTPVEINEKEKRVVVKLEGIDIHPIFCFYLKGYFSKITEIIDKDISQSQEIECGFNKGKGHVFLIERFIGKK